ncbi:molybdopterin converting factor subunit 1 [Paenalcaligenes suwonensis]|uniref:molybdopterin converting factor subunit 1 n=1 Tax=Paenalcaligenes suwonensis TaxID=1202713 RepID=UPI00140B9B5A|nr:molybdopterin converting factor subunit 1 [Paenalcaligenes suwonensis]NHC60697.1 molybdopterin converting factor subunit 1 [Paenalcaligenes suwonensis]
MTNTSSISVLYFAQVAELVGTRQETWPLSESLTVEHWLEQLIARYPQLSPLHRRLKIAVNQEYAHKQTVIHAGNEVAVFEPVTGG